MSPRARRPTAPMKVKTIARAADEFSRPSTKDAVRLRKNADPKLHPFEKAREYVRAVAAVKLDRMFAKPFVAAMSEHSDGVYCSATSPRSLVAFLSGAADGEVILWDLATHKKLWAVHAHAGFVRGLAVASDGESFVSCGDDKTVKQWRMASQEALAGEDALLGSRLRQGGAGAAGRGAGNAGGGVKPLASWTGKHAFSYIDHDYAKPRFATSSTAVDVWDYQRTEPVATYEWGADTVTTVRWNPAEAGLLASTGSDSTVCLYDTRADTPLRKVSLALRANALAWNPREPMNFVVACEDTNCYSFDMRNLSRATMVHKDHVGAVLDVAWSPTGKELVTGSYDRTVRIWDAAGGKSREVYFAKRMQRVWTVKFSGDAKYVLSGSDDANVRLWKAQASAPLGRLLPAERDKMDYRATLRERFAHMPEVRKISTCVRVRRARLSRTRHATAAGRGGRAHPCTRPPCARVCVCARSAAAPPPLASQRDALPCPCPCPPRPPRRVQPPARAGGHPQSQEGALRQRAEQPAQAGQCARALERRVARRAARAGAQEAHPGHAQVSAARARASCAAAPAIRRCALCSCLRPARVPSRCTRAPPPRPSALGAGGRHCACGLLL